MCLLEVATKRHLNLKALFIPVIYEEMILNCSVDIKTVYRTNLITMLHF